MYTRAQAEEIIANRHASEDDLANLVYEFMDLHKQIAMHPNLSPDFLEWMKAVTTDESVKRIIESRLNEIAANPTVAANPAVGAPAPGLPQPTTPRLATPQPALNIPNNVSNDPFRKPGMDSLGKNNPYGSVPTTPGNKRNTAVVVGSIFGVLFAVFVIVVAAMVLLVPFLSHSSNADGGDPSKSSQHAGPTDKLTEDQLLKDTTKTGAIKNPDGSQTLYTRDRGMQVDAHSNLLSTDGKHLFRLEGNILKPVKLGCKDCYIYQINYGIVLAAQYINNDDTPFIWDFNKNKRIKINARTPDVRILGPDLYMVSDLKTKKAATYDSSQKKLVDIDDFTAISPNQHLGDWFFYQKYGNGKTTKILNLRTGKSIDLLKNNEQFLKDAVIVYGKNKILKIYDANMKEIKTSLPHTCVTFSAGTEVPLQTLINALKKFPPSASDIAKGCSGQWASITISPSGKIMYKEDYDGPYFIGSPQGPKLDFESQNPVDDQIGELFLLDDLESKQTKVFDYRSTKPVITGNDDNLRFYKQLDHVLVVNKGKLESYK